ncbi:MAG: exopolyphosphatase/guanosine-5'-triphosphate,3'-diphosphate pyrophosphatase [Ilumatobacter sp.]|jgi:exopolyphosphatase/guanosine-5'-triphosphate,3'-diphosphate pyrophosphatase
MREETPDVVAAIDIGTNSMHLVVARLGEHGGFDILTSEKDMVRLGQGGGEMKQLASDAIERAMVSLTRMKQVAGSFGEVEIAAVATSAVREATNKNEFLDRARDELGIEVEVISGFEEARLIHLGVLQALPVFDRRHLIIDIGGGSTEFLVGEGDTTIEARSMKLGAIRLTERFFGDLPDGDGAVDPDAVDACRQYVRAALAPVAHELGGHQPEVVVGSSGTASTLAVMAAAKRREPVRQLNGTTFTREELDEVVESIVSRDTGRRRKLDGLDERRVDIIVAGSILLSEIFGALDIKEMTISDSALREGVLFDRFGAKADVRVHDLRRSNLMRLARHLDPDPSHAEHTARLAVQLFDRTIDLHELGDAERELLEAAAIVHNVGLFISHSSHHKHTYYVVRNSESLTGFTEHEIELIAVVARYHRKSHPSEKHDEFAALSKVDKRVVSVLAGMLRVAIGLDRRHAETVRTVRVFVDDSSDETLVRIEPVAEQGVDLDVEIYAARERSRLLATALDITVEVALPPAFNETTFSS